MDVWSDSYLQARQRFQKATADASVTAALAIRDPFHNQAPVLGIDGEALYIDIAAYGNTQNPRRVFVHTSGVHGVEGYAGSAVQLQVLRDLSEHKSLGEQNCIVFIHAVNPFGMSWKRRWNESNVDLNRNGFVVGPQDKGLTPWAKRGTSRFYHLLSSVLNPTVRGWFDSVGYYLNFFWFVIRYGIGSMKQAVVEGQDQYPNGLFFGGTQLEQSYHVLHDWFLKISSTWKALERMVIISVHTGLGKYGHDSLLTKKGYEDMQRVFGADRISADLARKDGKASVAYQVDGYLEQWLENLMRDKFPNLEFRAATQEFGTYSVVKVLQALRIENYEWHHGRASRQDPKRVNRALRAFYPSDPKWRAVALQRGTAVFQQACRLAFFDLQVDLKKLS